ncbi:MAG TPA: hypothetical protein VH575_00775 [Gemmataceae bacterium]
MADKSNQLILAALSRAAAADSVPLHGSKAVPGLFPTNAAGKQAAQRCQEDGYLCLIAAEDGAPPSPQPLSPRGGRGARGEGDGGTATLVKKKISAHPLCAITEKGLAYLLGQVSPRQVLEDFVRTLEARQKQADDLLALARHMQQSIECLKSNVEKVLQHTYRPDSSSERGGLKALFAGFLQEANSSHGAGASAAVSHDILLAELTRWHKSGTPEDCPLPHLYRQMPASSCSIGQFHDALRQLHDRGEIYLHPWTGPLYEIPEPPYALLIGHEIAYYASRREIGHR